MHKYEELEKLYYKKLYIKYFIYLLSFVIIIFVASFIYFSLNSNNVTNIKNIKNIKKNHIIDMNKTKFQKSTLKIKKIKKYKKFVKKLTLYPIYPDVDFIIKNKEKNKTNHKKFKSNKILNSKPIINKKIKRKFKKPEIKIIIKTETINDLINLYNIDPEFDNGMKIANYYFKHKKYEESIKWCKKVNKIKPEKYESWYLFAENLIQLNKNKEAKKVLIYYISNYGPNDKVEKLLRSIK